MAPRILVRRVRLFASEPDENAVELFQARILDHQATRALLGRIDANACAEDLGELFLKPHQIRIATCSRGARTGRSCR